MAIDIVTNDNYQAIRKSDKAIIAATMSWCVACAFYRPLLERTASYFPGISFGIAVLDQGKLGDFKRDYPDGSFNSVPVTFVYKEGEEVARFVGTRKPEALAGIIDACFNGDMVYLRETRRNRLWFWRTYTVPVPAMLEGKIDGPSTEQILKLAEDCRTGKKGDLLVVPERYIIWPESPLPFLGA